MAPTSYTIDPNWGESLEGLRIAVPFSWWPSYSGTELSLGKITKFDAAASPPFLLKVDDEPGNTYVVQYNAVLAYTEGEHPTFGSFHLPDTMPEEPSPDDTVVVWGRGRGRCWRGRKRRRVQARASSPIPGLISRADLASSNNSDNDSVSNNDSDGLGRLLPRHDDDDIDADNTDDADNDADDGEVVVGRTEAKNWKRVTKENIWACRHINPIPYSPREEDGELFDVKILDEDLKDLINENGDLRFH